MIQPPCHPPFATGPDGLKRSRQWPDRRLNSYRTAFSLPPGLPGRARSHNGGALEEHSDENAQDAHGHAENPRRV